MKTWLGLLIKAGLHGIIYLVVLILNDIFLHGIPTMIVGLLLVSLLTRYLKLSVSFEDGRTHNNIQPIWCQSCHKVARPCPAKMRSFRTQLPVHFNPFSDTENPWLSCTREMFWLTWNHDNSIFHRVWIKSRGFRTWFFGITRDNFRTTFCPSSHLLILMLQNFLGVLEKRRCPKRWRALRDACVACTADILYAFWRD